MFFKIYYLSIYIRFNRKIIGVLGFWGLFSHVLATGVPAKSASQSSFITALVFDGPKSETCDSMFLNAPLLLAIKGSDVGYT